MRQITTAFLLITALATGSLANDPVFWSLNTRAELLRGNAKDIAIEDDGTLRVIPKVREIFDTGQPFIWSSIAVPGDGFYLGTGGDGKLFKVDESGKGSMLADFDEVNVSALASGAAGVIYAATSPDGKVYRIDRSGTVTVFFEPKEKYVWSLAVLSDGSLAVATGDGGRIYKVKAAGALPKESILFDSSESHITSLETDRAGNLYAGSDSNGIVVRIGTDGKAFGLLDSPLREIRGLAVSPDGTAFALALSESVSVKSETPPSARTSRPVTVEKVVVPTPEQQRRSRQDLSSAKSAVHRILPTGETSVIWSSSSVSAFSLRMNREGDRLLIGTSDKGRAYQLDLDGGQERVTAQLSEEQVSNILFGRNLNAFVTSGQGKLFASAAAESPDAGVYESPVLDARASARWGRVSSRATGDVVIETRSGNTENPDETWSAWTALSNGQSASPRSRYFQWRGNLKGGATLAGITVAYRQSNIAPEILGIEVLPTNVGLAPNPGMPPDPNIELTGQPPAVFGRPNETPAPRRLYQRGARSLQWTAEDRNDDKLVFDVLYKRLGEESFRELRTELTDNWLTIDGFSLGDGTYVFAVVARDYSSNATGEELSGRRITEPVEIDNTAPAVSMVGEAVNRDGSVTAVFEASDAGNRLMRAEFSVDGAAWRTAQPEDGIADSNRERFVVTFSGSRGGGEVSFRVMDRNGNISTVSGRYPAVKSGVKGK